MSDNAGACTYRSLHKEVVRGLRKEGKKKEERKGGKRVLDCSSNRGTIRCLSQGGHGQPANDLRACQNPRNLS